MQKQGERIAGCKNKISLQEWKQNYCYFPSYGVAPHDHNLEKTGSFIGSTELKDKAEWPENFKEDPECPGLGVYLCPYGETCEKYGTCEDYDYFITDNRVRCL